MEALHKVDIKETVVVTPNMKVKDLATATRMSTRKFQKYGRKSELYTKEPFSTVAHYSTKKNMHGFLFEINH